MSVFRTTLLLLTLGFNITVFAQVRKNPGQTRPESMPVFPGGQQRLLSIVTDSLHYPALALRDRVEGKVYVSFTVDSTGSVINIFVIRGVRADLDAEALRNIQRLVPIRWQPGTQNGRPVSVVFTVPLTFSISQGQGLVNSSTTDSLDLNHGKTILFPTASWSASQKAIPADKGVIYGNCVQRLGFSSGGLGQYVRLINLDTYKAFRILVKPIMRSRKENTFCVALPAGRYALYEYEYSYGMETLRKSQTGSLANTRFIFTIQTGALHYVGTWNFSQPQKPTFTTDKSALDVQMSHEYPNLKVEQAIVALPR